MASSDNPRLQLVPRPVAGAQVDASAAWIAVVPAGAPWRELPYGPVLRRRHQQAGRKADDLWATDLPNARATRAVVLPIKPEASAFERLTLARKALDLAMEVNPRELLVSAQDSATGGVELEALASAALARAVALPAARKTPLDQPRLSRVRLHGPVGGLALGRIQAEAKANGLVRQLAALPPNELTPGAYRKRITRLAGEAGVRCEFLDERALRRRGAGAFLAVTQGSPHREAGILHLSWQPPRARNLPRVALVGKGLCYDTGGVNVKPARYMYGMHQDMAGSAVALGVMLALRELEVPLALDCWLALAENHLGPNAYKPNDVVRAADGTSIEIVHTDAEGRMVLADTLLLASGAKPSLIIDYATLTGSCIQALGKAYSGVFSNREALLPVLTAAGRASGERVWPFPLDADFDKGLESTVADVKQCSMDGEADHILAARFLQRFVQHAVPWVHVDLGAANHKGGLAHVPTEETGFGVRWSLNLLLDQDALGAAAGA